MKKVISSMIAVGLSLFFGGAKLHAADLKVGDDYERLPVNSKTQTQKFLRRAAAALKSAKNGR